MRSKEGRLNMRLEIKPLSVNEAWKGRRFKTEKYNDYRGHLLYLLPKNIDIPPGDFCVACRWGLSNEGADFDNPIKPFIDALQIKYGFNDKRIAQGLIEKVHVKKGHEFVEFFFYIEKICFESLKKYEYKKIT